MLILSRRLNEQVVINDDVIVTVIEIRGDRVRLGFTAPDEIEVHRMEVQRAIWRQDAARREGGGS